MPYGKDFLDTLNKMLNDGGQTSHIIAEKCASCGTGEVENSDDIVKMCKACSQALFIVLLHYSIHAIR